MKKYLLPVAFLILLAPFAVLFLLSSAPGIDLDPGLKIIGAATPIAPSIDSPHGVLRAAAYLEQAGQRFPLYEKTEPSHRLLFFRNERPRQYAFTAGAKVSRAQDGPAKLIVEATANDLRAAATTLTRDVTIITKPPALAADTVQHYINQGGSELVTYTAGGNPSDSGVQVGASKFRGFPLRGGRSLALFAYPWNEPVTTVPLVFASNAAGQVTQAFWFRVFPKSFRQRDLDIDDAFLARVVPQIDPGGSGDLLVRFLKINGDMRRRNNQTLADLRLKSEPRFLWTGPFLQLANSKVESQFADVRSYVYKGKKVDQQVHLGFDLSKVKNTPIAASNDGKVLLAEALGIYGNCVVIDHGYTLQSIYGHLSQIQVKPGEMVKRGQIIGLSGATGLAGGDHLHFSMQVDGVQVNPVEWWDEHWIKDRILSKIGAVPGG